MRWPRRVRWEAPLILAAPCCHHDIQRQLAAAGGVAAAPQPYGPLVRHGILRERFADVLTDALRASLLRLSGYRVDVVEFVDSRHTPRNALIRAVRTGARPTVEQVEEYHALTSAWRVRPALEVLLERRAGCMRAEAFAAAGLVVLTLAPPAGVHTRPHADRPAHHRVEQPGGERTASRAWSGRPTTAATRRASSVSTSPGRTVALLHLRGARARDWEALAPGKDADGKPLLWVGDLGDNRSTWPSVRVYRIAEPSQLGEQDVAWTAYDLRFPDGSRDAETLLVDPADQRLYVVSKRVDGAAVYEAPAHLRTDRVNVLTRVASAPSVVTDGSFSPDGKVGGAPRLRVGVDLVVCPRSMAQGGHPS